MKKKNEKEKKANKTQTQAYQPNPNATLEHILPPQWGFWLSPVSCYSGGYDLFLQVQCELFGKKEIGILLRGQSLHHWSRNCFAAIVVCLDGCLEQAVFFLFRGVCGLM